MNELATLLALPLFAGLLVLLTHAPLGEQVLSRGIVFIDLAVAQLAALGVLTASGWAADQPGRWWAGTLSALAGSVLVAGMARRWPHRREALIGLVYVGGAALAILWVSADPHGAQKLRLLLAGDILWVTAPALTPLAVATALCMIAWRWRPSLLRDDRAFYPCFALLVSLSVPLMGLYLVFTTLIVPALAAARLAGKGRLQARLIAMGVGAGGYAAGLGASLWLDLPSGPCIVLALMLCGLAACLVKPRTAAPLSA